ncbi:hypothetical protein ACFC26_37190 [Kitasatospora purpeofusca]|uniref:hypothetical protein n=1 Tax=Kitasatospora purpeofusca TaxID=67352 RepID=UPI0035DFA952
MPSSVLADRDIVSDFITVLTAHGRIHACEEVGDGRWKIRRTTSGPAEVLSSEAVEELLMDHLIAAVAARGLASEDLDF